MFRFLKQFLVASMIRVEYVINYKSAVRWILDEKISIETINVSET